MTRHAAPANGRARPSPSPPCSVFPSLIPTCLPALLSPTYSLMRACMRHNHAHTHPPTHTHTLFRTRILPPPTPTHLTSTQPHTHTMPTGPGPFREPLHALLCQWHLHHQHQPPHQRWRGFVCGPSSRLAHLLSCAQLRHPPARASCSHSHAHCPGACGRCVFCVSICLFLFLHP